MGTKVQSLLQLARETNELFDWSKQIKTDTQLKYSETLSIKEKLMHYKSPDYCFIAPAKTVLFLLLELQPLCQKRFGSKKVNETHVYF